ncbi:hypothetical protein [Pasteurella multocida]|uniref:hypothetical protein n=1 Tax=Pasteurella multocida TaxID=747 RepID=UPI00244BEEAC|nr:hypothetical protein [Pasteurella multocida]MDH3003277.1 hypothetical protein [Pasteurella multocida]
MCWRLLCVTEKTAAILGSLRQFHLKIATDIVFDGSQQHLICYDVSNGMCACGIIQNTDHVEVDQNLLAQTIKKWRRKGLSEPAIQRRLHDKEKQLAHKRSQQVEDCAGILDKWLKERTSPVYLLWYWQDKNQQSIRFTLPNRIIRETYQIPENTWVRYHVDEIKKNIVEENK